MKRDKEFFTVKTPWERGFLPFYFTLSLYIEDPVCALFIIIKAISTEALLHWTVLVVDPHRVLTKHCSRVHING